MNKASRLSSPVRDESPCNGCTEKFTACHGCCPKDKRGEYGYDAYQDKIKQVKEAKRQYQMRTYKYFHDYKEV
jgi:hypothetical protein